MAALKIEKEKGVEQQEKWNGYDAAFYCAVCSGDFGSCIWSRHRTDSCDGNWNYLAFCRLDSFLGLRVLKPQEALVITLFGKYVGTLKEDGFYYVNPFCTSVNPAAKTKLNQSGDVDDGSSKSIFLAAGGTQASLSTEATNKKIS